MGVTAMFMKINGRYRPDERGSLIVALAVMFVLVLLLSAVGLEVFGNQQNIVTKSNAAASVSAADAGLSDAVFRLDQLSPATGSTFCMDSNGNSPCVQAPTAPSPLSGVSYIATPSAGGTTWSIQAKAVVNGISGAAQETVNYSVKYPFAIFGNGGLDFNGQSGNTLGTYMDINSSSSSNPDTSTADCKDTDGDNGGAVGTDNDADSDDASCVKVGSNGPIKCAGGLPTNVGEVYYTGGGGASQCAEPIANSSKYTLSIPTAPTSGSPLTCPGVQTTDGSGDTIYELGSTYGVPSLSAGTYLCQNAGVAIAGTLSVQPNVSLYIILNATTDNAFISRGVQTLFIAGGSEVNTTFDGTIGPPPPGTSLPVASALQILSNSTGTMGNANGGGTSGPYTYGGVIYAPDANLVGNGCKSAYYGSITINTLTCNGGPHLQVYYDTTLSSLYGPPTISGYSQINPKTFTVP